MFSVVNASVGGQAIMGKYTTLGLAVMKLQYIQSELMVNSVNGVHYEILRGLLNSIYIMMLQTLPSSGRSHNRDISRQLPLETCSLSNQRISLC